METLEDVIAGPIEKKEEFEVLYELAFPAVARYIGRRGGSFDTAKDIFQDAMIIFFEKEKNGSLPQQVKPEAYISGIARHLWLRSFRTEKEQVSLEVAGPGPYVPEDYFPDVNQRRLLAYVEQAGKKCLELLSAFYYKNIPLKQIASAFGYTSEHSASVQKYKCLQKIRNTVREKSVVYEDFLE